MKKIIPGKEKRIVFVISNIQKSLAFEWIAIGLHNSYQLEFILLNPTSSPFESFLRGQNIKVKRVHYGGKQDFLGAFLKTFFYLLPNRPHVIHAHLFDAQLIGLTAAWIARIRERIYTRHNSNFHHVYHQQGVKYDRWSNSMATHIVSISQATDRTLLELEQVPASKIVKVPHGFDLNVFKAVSTARVQQVKKKWRIPDAAPIIGVIARHIEWKGIQFIIPAFKKFLIDYPDACLVLANAGGSYHNEIVNSLNSLSPKNVILISFEEDIAALYHTFDFYVHVPTDSICEAFGQTYVEALAAGIPSIFTLSGIACEFIEHNRNALVVEYKSDESIFNAMSRLWGDQGLRRQLAENGRQDVALRFDVEKMLTLLKKLYGE